MASGVKCFIMFSVTIFFQFQRAFSCMSREICDRNRTRIGKNVQCYEVADFESYTVGGRRFSKRNDSSFTEKELIGEVTFEMDKPYNLKFINIVMDKYNHSMGDCDQSCLPEIYIGRAKCNPSSNPDNSSTLKIEYSCSSGVTQHFTIRFPFVTIIYWLVPLHLPSGQEEESNSPADQTNERNRYLQISALVIEGFLIISLFIFVLFWKKNVPVKNKKIVESVHCDIKNTLVQQSADFGDEYDDVTNIVHVNLHPFYENAVCMFQEDEEPNEYVNVPKLESPRI